MEQPLRAGRHPAPPLSSLHYLLPFSVHRPHLSRHARIDERRDHGARLLLAAMMMRRQRRARLFSPMALAAATLVLALAVGRASAQGLGSCYYPGAEWAQHQHPCNLHSVVSVCCPTGWTCFSNSLCIVTDSSAAGGTDIGTTSRGTCTHPTWDEEVCGSSCLDSGNDGAMTACGNNTWCCSADVAKGHCDCDSGKGTFTVPAGKALAQVGDVDGQLTVTTGKTVPTSTGSVVRPSKHAASSSSSSAAASSAASRSSSSSTPSGAAATAGSRDSTQTSSPSSSSPPLARILGPIFGILALALLLALAWFLWRRRNRRRERTPSPSPEPTMHPPPVGPTEKAYDGRMRPAPAPAPLPAPAPVGNFYDPPARHPHHHHHLPPPPTQARGFYDQPPPPRPLSMQQRPSSGPAPGPRSPPPAMTASHSMTTASAYAAAAHHHHQHNKYQPQPQNSGYAPAPRSVPVGGAVPAEGGGGGGGGEGGPLPPPPPLRSANRNSGYTPIFSPTTSEQSQGSSSRARPASSGYTPMSGGGARTSRDDASLHSERRMSIPRKALPSSPPPPPAPPEWSRTYS